MLKVIKLIGVFIIILCCNFVNAQELSSVDQRKRDAMFRELSLSELQQSLIDTVFTRYAAKFQALDKRISEIESSGEFAEEDVVVRVSVLQQEKKDLRALRELDLKMLLQPEQVVIYDEKIQPNKPKVLHFGIHNRADCNVCTK